MSHKFYKTAQGKNINLEALRLTNEEVIAVGNMNVNSRGDEVDSKGQVIKPKNQIMKDYYSSGTSARADTLDDKITRERERARQERERIKKTQK